MGTLPKRDFVEFLPKQCRGKLRRELAIAFKFLRGANGQLVLALKSGTLPFNGPIGLQLRRDNEPVKCFGDSGINGGIGIRSLGGGLPLLKIIEVKRRILPFGIRNDGFPRQIRANSLVQFREPRAIRREESESVLVEARTVPPVFKEALGL